MAPKLSLAEQKKKLKEKEQRAKDNEKREKEKERGDRKAQEQRDKMFGLKNKSKGKAAAGALDEAERTLKAMPGEQQKAEAKARENARRKEAELKAQQEMEEMLRKSIKQPKVLRGWTRRRSCASISNRTCASWETSASSRTSGSPRRIRRRSSRRWKFTPVRSPSQSQVQGAA